MVARGPGRPRILQEARRVDIVIEQKDFLKLQELARKHKTSVSAIIRTAIKKFLRELGEI